MRRTGLTLVASALVVGAILAWGHIAPGSAVPAAPPPVPVDRVSAPLVAEAPDAARAPVRGETGAVPTATAADGTHAAAAATTPFVGVDYDVVWQVVDNVGALDAERCVRSLQLNPAGRPLATSFVERVRTRVEAFAARHREMVARIQAALSAELHRLAQQGRIPVLGRELHPEIHDRIEAQCRQHWVASRGVGAAHDWSGDAEYVAHFKNQLSNELFRETAHRLRIDIGATRQTHVATYRDCAEHARTMLAGDREALATEVMQFLVVEFGGQGVLSESEGAELLARFHRLQDAAMQARLAAFR